MAVLSKGETMSDTGNSHSKSIQGVKLCVLSLAKHAYPRDKTMEVLSIT